MNDQLRTNLAERPTHTKSEAQPLTDFAEKLEKCFALMRVEGASAQTIKNYENHMPHFFRHLEKRGIFKVEDVQPEDVEAYQDALYVHRTEDEKPLSVWTQITYISTVSAFFKRLVRAKVLMFSPASDIKLPRRDQRLPRGVMTRSEIKKLLKQPDLRTVYGFRDRCVLEVFVTSGIRTSELCDLEDRDIDFANGFLRIRQGKGLKDRLAPLGEDAQEFLRVYLDEVRPLLVKEPSGDYLFLTKSGRAYERSGIYSIFRKCSKSAKMKRTIIPRYLRYTLATEMLRGGARLPDIQAALGHSSLNTLDVYCQVVQSDIKREVKKKHCRYNIEQDAVFLG